MKLNVLCAENGEIISIQTGSVRGTHADRSEAGVNPGPDQTLHTIDAGEEMQYLSLADIYREYTVQVTKGTAQLVRGPNRTNREKK